MTQTKWPPANPGRFNVPIVTGFVGLLICLGLIFANLGGALLKSLVVIMENVGAIDFRNSGDAALIFASLLKDVGYFLGPPLGVIILGGLAGSFFLGIPRIAVERITPDLTRISPVSGWKRLFGLQGLIELVKTLFKLLIVGGAITFVLSIDRGRLTDALRIEPRALPHLTQMLLTHLLAIVCVVGGVLALADMAWSRFKWRRDLRMDRQELKEEFKQSEGDAFVKARMRSLAQSRARKRMMQNVPRASLVLVDKL